MSRRGDQIGGTRWTLVLVLTVLALGCSSRWVVTTRFERPPPRARPAEPVRAAVAEAPPPRRLPRAAPPPRRATPMTEVEFRAIFARLTASEGEAYVQARTELVGGGEAIIPWLRAIEASAGSLAAVDARIVRSAIEDWRMAPLVDGILDGSLAVPAAHGMFPRDSDRIRVLLGAPSQVVPRLLDGLLRGREFDLVMATRARSALAFIADPSSRDLLRLAIGDGARPLRERVELARVLWSAFRDARVPPLADALARDDNTPPSERSWAIDVLTSARDPSLPALFQRLLTRPDTDPLVALTAVEAVGTLGDPALAPLLEEVALTHAFTPEVRVFIPEILVELRGRDAIPVLRRIAAEDPDRDVRSSASMEISMLH